MELSYFEETNEDGSTIVNRPETKTTSDLERVIALGKPTAVIEAFADMVATGEQWAWYDSYKEYLNDLEAHIILVDTHIPEVDSEGVEIEWVPPIEPTEPVRPLLQNGEEVLIPYYASRRAALYPELTDFADAFVKAQAGDNAELEQYVANCLQVKEDIPKSI